jgi:hypothetical protein
MKALEVKDKLIEYIMQYLEPKGFKYKKKNSSEFEIVQRKDKNGFNRISGGFANFSPVFRIDPIGFGIRHSNIADILDRVNELIPLTPSYSKDRGTFNFLADVEYTGSKPEILSWNEEFSTDEGLRKQVYKVIEFLENGGMKAFDKYQDLREVDRIFNDLENFWDRVTPIGYSLGGFDNLTRLIVAKLSGNPHYEEVVNKSYELLDKIRAEKGLEPFDRSDLTKPAPYTVHLLKDIKPLYESYE